jgi:putative zinc finger protein
VTGEGFPPLAPMNCTQARFLLYAHLDRDISRTEAEALSRHLAGCEPCEARSRSARGLAVLLRSRLDREHAPPGLLIRLRRGAPPEVRPRVPAFVVAAAVLVAILPVVADGPATHPAAAPAIALSSAISLPSLHPAARQESHGVVLTGTLVCLQCEARHEAGLCPLPESAHEAGFCADNGEVWRLMARDPSAIQTTMGQTVTVEGVAFPQSGFLRASRVGY